MCTNMVKNVAESARAFMTSNINWQMARISQMKAAAHRRPLVVSETR